MANEKMELKAYKLLADLQGKLLDRITLEAERKAEYCKDKPEESQKWMEYISNPDKWDYCGLMSKEDMKVLDTIEYLLNNDATEIKKRKEWKPSKH
ncbi:MAG: hypothetical protein WC026_13045 [Hyphomicrobium sp.]|uniref:hypothetical protein n=1 Tax=Hyphomicrobium sp. TaxID=82 RepID=UPI003567E840